MSKYPFSWIKHNRDQEGDFGARMILHILPGFFMGLFFPITGPMVGLFLEYERNEDSHTLDQAWKDLFGALVGYCPGAIINSAFWLWLLLNWR